MKMMITVNSVKNRHLKRFLEHSLYFLLMVLLIPAFLYFELCIVLPAVVEEWSAEYFVHIFCAMFLLFNIVGNLIFGVFTDTSIRGRTLKNKNDRTWEMCAVCECYRPPRTWHCEMCNICILKRDHHCTFFASCVGYYNFRYFILFTMYVFIGMVYAFIYNIKFLSQFITWNHGLVIMKFIFPLAGFVLDFGAESLYVFLVLVNVIVVGFTGFLFFYHFNNILCGRTVHETKHENKNFKYNKGWKQNIVEVLGQRWYLAWTLPFISSPLPGNGIDWDIDNKYK